jgi:hypothetical protein
LSRRVVRITALFAAVALAAAVGSGASAHEGHGKPALIQTGTCDALGGAAFTLIGVGAEEDAEGLPVATPAAVGPESAAPLTTSTSTVDATVETIVEGGHAIVVYASDAEMDNPIACGAVGGIQLGEDLVVGLDPVGEEGMSGVALLRNSGTQATVTIVLNKGEGHGHEEGAAATPEA